MPVNLRQNDPILWQKRMQFIERLKRFIGYCELSGNLLHLDAHEFLAEYNKKQNKEVNALFLLHPGNVLVINNALHINQKPTVEACILAVYRRRADVCRSLGFVGGKAMVVDFCKQAVELQKKGLIKILPPYVLTLSELKNE